MGSKNRWEGVSMRCSKILVQALVPEATIAFQIQWVLNPTEYVPLPVGHRWELPSNNPVFTVIMVIYHYVERIRRILVTPIFNITYMIINIYYPGEPVNIHIQPLISIIQENNW